MIVNTLKFGAIDAIEEDQVHFPGGLVGLTGLKNWLVVPDPAAEDLFWLQSVDRGEFALALIHASKLSPSYRPVLPHDQLIKAGLSDQNDAEIFVVINRCEGKTTANLMGPIVVNPHRMLGVQAVLNEKEYGTRHELTAVGEPQLAIA